MDRHHRFAAARPVSKAARSPVVVTRGLSKDYGCRPALIDCNVSIEPGEVFGLLGPNGAGKTTLIRLLMGFLKPTAGEAHIGGFDCWHQPVDVHRLVAYLPGDARLYGHLRGRRLIELFARLRGQRDAQRGMRIAQQLQLDTDRRVVWMSTGMRQKLALAVTLAADAAVYILDEPTANLDPTVRSYVLELIAKLRDEGRTVVFSSHVLSEVEEVCDRVAILQSGRLVHTQVTRDLKRQYRIEARMANPPSEGPPHVAIRPRENGWVTMEANGELAPLLRWLATLPIEEISIHSQGLRSVYDRFHGNGALLGDAVVEDLSPPDRSAKETPCQAGPT